MRRFEPEVQVDFVITETDALERLSHCYAVYYKYTLCIPLRLLRKFNFNFFSKFWTTFSPHLADHYPEFRKQKQLEVFYSHSSSDWSLLNFFDLAATKIASHTPDEKQHIFTEPREQKTESLDNSPEQMRLSPIWSIIALTNK